MHQVKLNEAESKLAELVDEVASGEDVMITRGDGMSFRIVVNEEQKPTPTYGSARGLIKMADDFDEPLAHLAKSATIDIEVKP